MSVSVTWTWTCDYCGATTLTDIDATPEPWVLATRDLRTTHYCSGRCHLSSALIMHQEPKPPRAEDRHMPFCSLGEVRALGRSTTTKEPTP